MNATGEYRLDDLGWWQFEHLCQTLLQAEIGLALEVWGGHSDLGRDAYVEGSLYFPERAREQRGPFVFQAKFVANARAIGNRAHTQLRSAVKAELTEIERRKQAGKWAKVRVYTLLTNVRIPPKLRSDLTSAVAAVLGECRVLVLGEGELSTRLTASPAIRESFPQLLSLRDLKQLVEDAVQRGLATRSLLMLQHARELSPVFVPTGAYNQALTLLDAHGFVVLTGPPELGKTSIAETIALARSTEGWQIFDCESPQDLFDGLDRKQPQLFVVDDAFGTTEFDPDRSEAWARSMHKVLAALRSPGQFRAQLIWTSRPQPLHSALARLRESTDNDEFPQPHKIVVDASRLSIEEKSLMLYRHAKAAGLSEAEKTVVRRVAVRVVANKHFTPARIRRFASAGIRRALADAGDGDPAAVDDAVLSELAQATARMQNSYEALDTRHRVLLFSLLEATGSGWRAPGDDELREAYARHAPEDAADPVLLAERLEDHFIRVRAEPNLSVPRRVYSWVHPSWRDLVIENLAADRTARQHFIERCGFSGFSLAISVAGGATGERAMPLLQNMQDWDALSEVAVRLARSSSVSPWSVLTRLTEAWEEEVLSDPHRRALARVMSRVLAALRERWLDAPATNSELKAYWDASEKLQPLPPSPPLGTTWLKKLRDARSYLDLPGSLSYAGAEALGDLFNLAQLIEDNEPRFLRQQHYPESEEDLWGSVRSALENAVDEAEGSAREGEAGEVDRLTRICELLEELPGYVGLDNTELDDLFGRLEWEADEERRIVAEHEWEPDDDDVPRGGRRQSIRTDIDAMFADL